MKNSSAFHFNECGFSAHIPSNKYVLNQLFACVVYGLLFIPTVLLNGISIFIILKCSQLKEKVCYFTILMQSAVDLTTGVITLPILTAHVLFKDVIHVENKVLCSLNFSFGHFLLTLSVFTLCVLSFERYMGVVHPFIHHTSVTKKRIMKYQCRSVLLTLLFYGMVINMDSGDFHTILFFLDVLIPLVFLLYIYTKIFITTRKSLSIGNRPGDNATQPGMSEMKRKRRFLRELNLEKSCFLVTYTFGLCFLPSMVLALAIDFLDGKTAEILWSWTTALSVLNSSLNSIIFFWSNAMLRKEAKKVLKICCSKSSPSS
jgi:hypothetical protein